MIRERNQIIARSVVEGFLIVGVLYAIFTIMLSPSRKK